MRIENATVLVTGANQGSGRESARQSLEHGADTVAGMDEVLTDADIRVVGAELASPPSALCAPCLGVADRRATP
ncbi:hypothetical protein [Modestobacter versicolor]|uniref:NAD(P)-dependent dehydrogenase (Short-subunit alcohol dehydrogenase family) n=1 Tax=Modestobacter versicolor TaxID=429133 RepID=A0A839Y379_9ACTN|nr:hypothetical protein [Modestobacter versicolor]MBB3674664.1 NAD(P)-dependent dehydrogenase (short-subunit alcohol dehydrogenase family) [Modestobacter versicolor]